MKIITAHALTSFDGTTATLECSYTGQTQEIGSNNAVLATQRTPNDCLYHDILATVDGDATKLPFTLTRIGDCEAPSIVAAAVYAGHRLARELGEDKIDTPPFKREIPTLATD